MAGAIPLAEPLALSSVQKRLAGPELSRLLKKRITYHHSGLSYQQRAGLIEPLAKAGQLRIVVSTTGLASGVNFSMRSVIVTESDFMAEHEQQVIRPDELLQMFGRAGRRGLDERGFALIAPGKPRLSEARSCAVKRPAILDWPSLIGAMGIAVEDGRDPFETAVSLGQRLFQGERLELGVEHSLTVPDVACRLKIDGLRAKYAQPAHSEMQNSGGEWESMREVSLVALKQVQLRRGDEWVPFLEDAESVRPLGRGALHRFEEEEVVTLGKRIVVGFVDRRKPDSWKLAAWFRTGLESELGVVVDRLLGVDYLDAQDSEVLSKVVGFGQVVGVKTDSKRVMLVVDLKDYEVEAYLDSTGVGLIDPVVRKSYAAECCGCAERVVCEETLSERRSPAWDWYRLGLIDGDGVPTRRGRIFSFFQNGEGLAIAAALEEKSYSVDSIAHDIANLRAGFRFDESGNYSHRLARACRTAYSDRSYEGYLRHGLPPQYGEGAAEVIAAFSFNGGRARGLISEVLKPGDVERVRLEWMSLLRQVRGAPELEWSRWVELKAAVEVILESDEGGFDFDNLPSLEAGQQGRVNHQLRFPRGF